MKTLGRIAIYIMLGHGILLAGYLTYVHLANEMTDGAFIKQYWAHTLTCVAWLGFGLFLLNEDSGRKK